MSFRHRKKSFQKHFPHASAASTEDIAYEIGEALFELNVWLEALSYRKKEVHVSIDWEDSDTLSDTENEDEALYYVNVEISTEEAVFVCDHNGTDVL